MKKEKATLVFVRRNGKMLLGLKKRGVGAGNINGIGGRIKPGEPSIDCAKREFKEEVGAIPIGLKFAGLLNFRMPKDNFFMQVFVYTASNIKGKLVETVEMKNLFWYDEKALPYHKMWADDRVWIPWMLEGREFFGEFCIEDGKVLSCNLNLYQEGG